jgi:hypothetical protein
MSLLLNTRRWPEDEDHTPDVDYCCETCGDSEPVHDTKKDEYICRECIDKKIAELANRIVYLENL